MGHVPKKPGRPINTPEPPTIVITCKTTKTGELACFKGARKCSVEGACDVVGGPCTCSFDPYGGFAESVVKSYKKPGPKGKSRGVAKVKEKPKEKPSQHRKALNAVEKESSQAEGGLRGDIGESGR